MFGAKLRMLRKNLDISQTDLAIALEVTQTVVSALEHRDDAPRGDLLAKIANYFGVSVDYFFNEPSEYGVETARAYLEALRVGESMSFGRIIFLDESPVPRKTKSLDELIGDYDARDDIQWYGEGE